MILTATGTIGAALLLAACGRPVGKSPAVAMQYEISPQPARRGPVRITFRLADGRHTPLAGAHLKLEGDMSHPGMAPAFGNVTETEPGRYEGSLDFNMAGDWVIIVRGTLADGERFERQVGIPGVRPD